MISRTTVLKRKKMKNFFKVIVILMALSACTESIQEQFGTIDTNGYAIDTISVKYQEITQLQDTTEYEISDCLHLQLPPEFPALYTTLIMRNKDRIYILDKKINKTVLVFNDKGEFLHQLGKIGHAKNEYIKRPTGMSINYTNGEVHVYERDSRRVLVFGNDGMFLRSVTLKDCMPSRMTVTTSGNYLCAFCARHEGSNNRLALYNSNGEFIKGIYPLGTEERLSIWNCLHSCNDVICYNPMMTDLVALFKNDEIMKYIKVDFGGAFIDTKKIQEAHTAIFAGQKVGSFDPILKNKGVNYISYAEQSESLFHVHYTTMDSKRHDVDYIMNKKNGKHINFQEGKIQAGLWPSERMWIYGDQIITVLEIDDVENVRNLMNSDKENGAVLYERTHPMIQSVIDGKIKAPVFVSIRMK